MLSQCRQLVGKDRGVNFFAILCGSLLLRFFIFKMTLLKSFYLLIIVPILIMIIRTKLNRDLTLLKVGAVFFNANCNEQVFSPKH